MCVHVCIYMQVCVCKCNHLSLTLTPNPPSHHFSCPPVFAGDDEDLKGITVLYASDAGKHITGQFLAIDGGVSAVLG